MILSIKNINKNFGGIHALSDFSVEIEEKKIIAFIGPNGAGKTTLFNIITGYVQADSGFISFNGRPILGKTPWQIAKLGIGRTFQSIKLFSNLSILENILIGERFLYGSGLIKSIIFRPLVHNEIEHSLKEATKILETVGLISSKTDRYKDLAINLSYGQKKLLELARLIMFDPILMLLDEPASGIDKVMLGKIFEVLSKKKKEGHTIILIEHDMNFVSEICDYIINFKDGYKEFEGDLRNIFGNKKQ